MESHACSEKASSRSKSKQKHNAHLVQLVLYYELHRHRRESAPACELLELQFEGTTDHVRIMHSRGFMNRFHVLCFILYK